MIAIPTLSAGEPLEACLKAIGEQQFRDFEVVVIDNGGRVVEHPESIYPLRILRPGRNLGFGAAVNLAIRSSSAPLIVCLNDDTEPSRNFLTALVDAALSHDDVGMCAPRIILRESGKLDSAGMLICLDGSSKQRGHGENPERFSREEDVLFPSGCAAMYRRAALDEAGLFDEDFFLYCEDTDLGLRLRRAGWRCRYVPAAVVMHRYSVSAGAWSRLKARYVERNRIRVAIRNFPLPLLLLCPLTTVMRLFWQLVYSIRGEGAVGEFARAGNSPFKSALLVFGVWAETAISVTGLWRQRLAIARACARGSNGFAELLLQHRIGLRELARA